MSRLISELDTALAWLERNLPAGRHAPIAEAAHAPFLSHQEEFFARFDDFADGR